MIKISNTEYFSNDKTIHFLNMDCNEFMAQCKENEFDLIHNDPPYGLERFKKGGSHVNKYGSEKGSWNNEKPSGDMFNEMFRVSKKQIIWGGNNFELPTSEYFIIWQKSNALNFSFAMCEQAWTNIKKPAKLFTFFIVSESESRIHPTQKPIELYCWILDNYTKPTDTILDCFGGSMSNAIACHMKRRKLTIIELDVDYFKSALNRFETYERQTEDIAQFGFAKNKLQNINPTLF